MAGTPGTSQSGQSLGLGAPAQFSGQPPGLSSAMSQLQPGLQPQGGSYGGGLPQMRPGMGQMPMSNSPMMGPRQGGPLPPTGMPPQAPPGTQVIGDPSVPGAGPWSHYLQMMRQR